MYASDVLYSRLILFSNKKGLACESLSAPVILINRFDEGFKFIAKESIDFKVMPDTAFHSFCRRRSWK